MFYGCALLNAVSVDINWRLAAPEVLFIANDSQAEVLIVGQEFVPILDAIIGQLARIKTIIVIGGHPSHDDYEQWVNAQSATDPKAPTKSSDVAFQLYSSGTTGRPKGVMLTNDNYFALLPAAQKFGCCLKRRSILWRCHCFTLVVVVGQLRHNIVARVQLLCATLILQK